MDEDALIRCVALLCACSVSDDAQQALGVAESFREYLTGDEPEISFTLEKKD